jgi:hypothetical protein
VLHLFNDNILTGCGYLLKLSVKETLIRILVSMGWTGTLFCLTAIALAYGQTTPSSQSSSTTITSQNASIIQAYAQEQRALMRQQRALVAQGATQQQLQAWHAQNAAQFAAQDQRAQTMAASSALQLRRTNHQPNIPANASLALKDLLNTRAALANARAQIHNQLVQGSSGTNLTFAQLGTLEQSETQLFQQQNSALLAVQAQQVQALTPTSVAPTQTARASAAVPGNATPQMAAFLSTRYQLRQSLIQLQNQYATASPAARNAVLQQWRQENASHFTQLQQQAQTLSQATPTVEN